MSIANFHRSSAGSRGCAGGGLRRETASKQLQAPLGGEITSRPQRQVRLASWDHTGTLAPSMRLKLASLAAISMAVGLAACTKIESRDLIREGNQLYIDTKYEEAIEKYNQSLEKEPDGVTVLWNRAMAAESIVLGLKDMTDEKLVAKRREFATLALESLDQWNERRDKIGPQDEAPECARKPPKSGAEAGESEEEEEKDPDLEAYKQHRLAILGADARCDDLIEHWRQMHMACPQNEDLYMTIAQTFEDICGMPDKAEEWYVKRTEDFPESAKAWYSLATRRFYPLLPEPDAAQRFNPNVVPEERIRIADEVIGYLEKASALDSNYRDPYAWRSMAYTQKSLARVYVDPPDTPEDAIEAILARRDLMLAWRETKAVCDIDNIPDCPVEVDEAGLPPALKPAVLFAELEIDGSSWKTREINLWGNVVNESVKQTDQEGFEWQFDLEVPYVPLPPVLAEGEEPPKEPPPPPEKTTKKVTVRYTFLKPEVAEGEEPPDVSSEIEAQLDVWKRLKSTGFKGFIEGKGGELTLVVQQKPLIGCCPAAPLSPEEEKADAERLEQLHAEIAAAEEAAKQGSIKGKGKGKGKKR
jgi:tetratricopeptide (TPR) repeat protein